MASAKQDILLIGCGAVGAIYALTLTRSGFARVTVVARSNYDLVNAEGITFKSLKYGNISGWKPDRFCKSIAEAADRSYSYVVVTTKAIPDLTSTSKLLEPLLSAPYSDLYPQPAYILLQNGLNVEIDLYSSLKALNKGEPRIISAALYIYTGLLEPNVVEHGDFDRASIGVYRHKNWMASANSPEEATLLEDIGKILETGGTNITIVPEIQRHKFSKNFWNVAFSSFSTLTNYTLPAIFRPPPADSSQTYTPYVSPTTADLIKKYTIPVMRDTLNELLALGRVLGFPDSAAGIPSSTVDDLIELTRSIAVKPNSTHKPSMLIDAEQGRPIEVEVIFGEPVRMARELNVEMPRVEMLYALLLVMQNQTFRKMESRL